MRVLGQKIEGDALDDAGEGELDVNDVAIELAAGKIHGVRSGVPGGIRTPNLLIRSQKLYPVELQAQV